MCAFCVAAFTACDNAKQDVIVVGYTLVEPLNYLDENNELVGFDTELARLVFENLGYSKVIFKEIKWESKYTDLSSGNIDCIWNGFTANCAEDDGVQRSEKVDFSYNYMENRQVIVVNKSETDVAINAEAFNDKIGYVEANSAGATYAEATFAGAVIKEATKQTDAILQVRSGAAYFAVVDAQLAKSTVGKGDYAELAMLDVLSSDVEYYAVGFKKGSELTAKVNAELEALAENGTVAKLAEKYGVITTVITDFFDQKNK